MFEESREGSVPAVAEETVEAARVINIQVVMVGKKRADVALYEGIDNLTVGGALEKAQMEVPQGFSLQVNTEEANRNTPIQEGDIIGVVEDIEGGR
jgi:hypothetical protein